MIVTDIKLPKSNWYSWKYEFGFFDNLTEDKLINFHKIQNFICIQACDRPNFKKPEKKHTCMMSTQRGGGEGGERDS